MRLGQAVETHLTHIWVPRMQQQQQLDEDGAGDNPGLHWSFEYHVQEYQLFLFYANTIQQLFQDMDAAIAQQGTKVPTSLPIVLQFGHSLLFQPYWKDLLTQTVLEFVEWDRRQDEVTNNDSATADTSDLSAMNNARKMQRRREWMKHIVSMFVQLDTVPRTKPSAQQPVPLDTISGRQETYLRTLQNTVADTTLDFYRSKRDTEWRRLSYEDYQQKAQAALDAEERRGSDYLEQLWVVDDGDENNAEATSENKTSESSTQESTEDKLSWTIFCPTTGWFEVRSELHTLLIKQAPVDPHNPLKGGKVACVTACTLGGPWWKKLASKAPKRKPKQPHKKPTASLPPTTPVTKAPSWKSARSEIELKPSGSSDRTVVTVASPMLSSPPSYPSDDQASTSSPPACIVEAGSWMSQSQHSDTQQSLKEETDSVVEKKEKTQTANEHVVVDKDVETIDQKENETNPAVVAVESELDPVFTVQTEEVITTAAETEPVNSIDDIPASPKSVSRPTVKELEDEGVVSSPYEVEEDYELGEISYSIDPSDDPFHNVEPPQETARMERIGTFKVNSSFDEEDNEDFLISSGGLDDADEWSIPAVETASKEYSYDEWSQHSGVASYNSQNDDWAEESQPREAIDEIEPIPTETSSVGNQQDEESVVSYVTMEEEDKTEERTLELAESSDSTSQILTAQSDETEALPHSTEEVNTSVVIAYDTSKDPVDANEENVNVIPPVPSTEDVTVMNMANLEEKKENDEIQTEPPAVPEKSPVSETVENIQHDRPPNPETLVTAERVEFAKDQGVVASIHSQSLFCL